ncbi:MAG: MaoC family dehydratase [Burkholderiales bacterium]|nr:MaoC family dehydratase [Burkholderiales bacterium]
MNKDEVLQAMQQEIGRESEPGEWFVVDQDLINRYVAISGEDVWIHTDPERARKETKYGNTIAPGNLGIALMPRLSNDTSVYGRYPRRYSLNQGWDRIRYLAPLTAGSRIRSRSKLLAVDAMPDGSLRVQLEYRMEIENQDKPWVSGVKVGRFFY